MLTTGLPCRTAHPARGVIVRFVVICLGALALATVAAADDIAAGLWELSLDARVEADPGFQPGPLTVNQCVTKGDTKDPSKILGPITTSGAADCNYSEKRYVGETFHFTVQCSGTLGLKTAGEVTFSPTALRGTMTTWSTIDGKQVEFKSTIAGRRIGDC